MVWPVGTNTVVIATGDRLRHAEWTNGLHISPGGSTWAARNIFVLQKCDFCLVHLTPPYTPWRWPCNLKAISQRLDSPWSPIWPSWKCAGLDTFCHPAVIYSLSIYHMTHECGNWSRVPLQQPSLYTTKHTHSYNLQIQSKRPLCFTASCSGPVLDRHMSPWQQANLLASCPFPDTQRPRLYLGQGQWFLQILQIGRTVSQRKNRDIPFPRSPDKARTLFLWLSECFKKGHRIYWSRVWRQNLCACARMCICERRERLRPLSVSLSSAVSHWRVSNVENVKPFRAGLLAGWLTVGSKVLKVVILVHGHCCNRMP